MLFPNPHIVAFCSGVVPFALYNGVAAASTAVPQPSLAPAAPLRRLPPPPATRPTVEIRARSHASGSATYTIRDVGMPAADTYASPAPIGFNNSGQIYGTALRKAKGNRYSYFNDTDCLVWTGARFIDLAPSLTVTVCNPYAINSADPKSGKYNVVGSFDDIFHLQYDAYSTSDVNNDAFLATVLATGASTLVPYYDHSPAALFGVNAQGTGAGFSYAAPVNNASSSVPIFLTAPPETLTRLQPLCATSKTACLSPLRYLGHQLHGEPNPHCPFGGCTINDGGAVLGFDSVTGRYAVYTNGAASPVNELSLLTSTAYVVSMNGANQIVYFTQVQDSVYTVTAAVYDVASGASTIVPPVPGTNCAHYFPISMNNRGAVLGFTTRCASRDFYWTWDPLNGTRDLSDLLPPNPYKLQALGINDNAQILVSLQTAAGTTHWGILDPPLAPMTPHSKPQEQRHAR